MQSFVILVIIGLFIVACDSDSGSEGGATGGSGEVESTPVAAADNNNNTTSSSSDNSTTASSSNIVMDARAFNCTPNWTNRDGAWGLRAYSGSGTCSMPFPGETGTYELTLHAVLEFDGHSPYRVSINGATIKQGVYPLATPMGCDCPLDEWWIVCPDKDSYIGLGTHTIVTGDTIEFYGAEDFPCGDHGSYAKWQGIRATKK